MNLVSYSFNGTPSQGYIQNTLVNQNLTWETTRQFDGGFDARFFGNRFGLTADYYEKRTTGILLRLPIPATIGENASYQNAGIVDANGWEFQANYNDIAGKIKYNIAANFNISHNKVVSLAGTGPYIYGSSTADDPQYIVKEGLPIYGQWGYKTNGIFQTQQEIGNSPVIKSNTKPGDLKYVDVNGDGKINPSDETYLGNSFPVYTFGSTIGLQYKGFELNVLLQGAAGIKQRISGALAEIGINEGFVDANYTNNYWTPQNTTAHFPRPIKHDFSNFYPSQTNLWDGSYLRLKNIQLTYTLPATITKKVYISSASIYISATNFVTISRFYHKWHLDPEQPEMPLVQSGNEYVGGRSVYYPQTMITTFGLKLQF